jgi:hypothetical protein
VDTIFFSAIALRNATAHDEYKEYAVLGNLDIQIKKSYVDSLGLICRQKKEADESVGTWQEYSKNPSFQEGKELKSLDAPNGVVYYYSPSVKLFGLPVIARCTQHKSQIGMAMRGRSCSVSAAAGKNNYITVRLYDEALTPENWGEAISKIESFIRLLSRGSIAAEKFQPCN